MPYILIAVFLAGYGLAYKVDRVEIFALKNAIEKANEQGRSAMVEAQRIADHAQEEAKRTNIELDKANEASITTINTYYDRVRKLKARSNHSVSKSDNPSIHTKHETNRYDILAELHRADLAAIEKNTLLKFVRNKCGIKDSARPED